jgi:2-oxoglutarate ferredoxin oxidoreductase subunit delta
VGVGIGGIERRRLHALGYYQRRTLQGMRIMRELLPKQTLAMADHLNPKGYYPAEQVKKEACIGCSFCVRMCPDVAISVYREEKQPASKQTDHHLSGFLIKSSSKEGIIWEKKF